MAKAHVDPDRYLSFSKDDGEIRITLADDHNKSAQITLTSSMAAAAVDALRRIMNDPAANVPLISIRPTPPKPAPAPRRNTGPGALLDKGGHSYGDDTEDIPALALSVAADRVAAYGAAHSGHYPPAPIDAGNNSDRQSVGQPGHCSVCAILGHVVAHPERGCGDVRCDMDHEGPGQITRHECTYDGKALPFGRKAPIGECLRCDQLRAGAKAREAHPAIGDRRNNGGYPSSARIANHFTPGGPHARGDCGPVCTFGDY